MFHRSAVLCALATTSISIAVAQPADVPIADPNQPAAGIPPLPVPILPMTLEEFMTRNGGLTRLKLKLDNATADEIAVEMKVQTGLNFMLSGQVRGSEHHMPRFSVEATGQPFWQAIAQWNRGERKLRLQHEWGAWTLVPQDHRRPGRALMTGPFHMMVNSIARDITRSRDFDPDLDPVTGPKLSDVLSLHYSLRVDPKFHPLIALTSTKIESATDDLGRTVAPAEKDGTYAQQPYDQSSFPLQFAAPEADAKSLHLKGVIRVAAVTKREHWEIDLKADPQTERTFTSDTAQVTYRLDGVSEGAAGTTAKLHIAQQIIGPKPVFKHGRGGGSELGDFDSLTNSIRFLNAAGEVIRRESGNIRVDEKGSLKTYDFEINITRNSNVVDSTPVKMIVDVPLEWREVIVPFELKDLPLP